MDTANSKIPARRATLRYAASLLVLLTCLPRALFGADPLHELFREPTPEYRPFVRWWWNGARVDTKEAIRQLEVLQAAGFGGVEINTIAMPEYVDPSTLSHAPELTWLAKEWSSTVDAVTRAAEQRGLTADIIVGSGWPFGGEFLEPEDQIKRLRIVKKTISGPFSETLQLSELAHGADAREDHEAANAIKPSRVEFPFLRLISEDGDARTSPLGEELISEVRNGAIALRVPAGEHQLVLGVLETGYTTVKSGAPGAKGPVLDHFNAPAVRNYLERMSDRMAQNVGPEWSERLRAAFVDSLELDHSNWSEDFEAEFQKRRGYAVAPYLPFLLDSERQDEISRRARYDFCKTLIELFDERFTQTYAQWCERHGLESRMQAYGRETHPLHGSMEVSLPEGETWLWHDEGERPRLFVDSTAVNKYVSSAAHLTGTRTVSFEAMTNAVPVFRETLGDFKRALDLTLLDGPNHPIIHGFNYTPLEAGFPGWVRFGSYLNERNPFWPHMYRFNEYAARLGVALRNSDYQAQIAVLAPRAEEWERAGLLYQPFPEIVYPWYQYRLPTALQKLGFGVDFVSEELIAEAKVEGETLVINGRPYRAVIVEEVEALSLPAARTLRSFSDAQGRIAFIGSAPKRESGLAPGWQERSRQVEALFTDIHKSTTLVAPPPSQPQNHPKAFEPGTRGKPFDDSALIAYLASLTKSLGVEPVVRVREPSPWVSFVRHVSDDQREFVFVSNSSVTESIQTKLDLSQLPPNVEVWDPETGQRHARSVGGEGELTLSLPPLHSSLLAFSSAPSAAPPLPDPKIDAHRTIDLSEDWELTAKPIDGAPAFRRSLARVSDLSLSDDAALRDFSGSLLYKKTFRLSSPAARAQLSLGSINGTSRLLVDGREVGTRWYGDHNYTIEGLAPGHHTLEVEVTTTLGNHVRSQENNPAAKRWAFWFRPIETGILGPVKLKLQNQPD